VRRATAALLGTVTGTVLLVGLKYGGGSTGPTNVDNPAALADPSGGSAGAGTPDPSAAESAQPPATAGPAGSAAGPGAGATAGPSAPPASRSTPGRSAAPSRTAPAPPAPPACTTATGDGAAVSKPAVGAVTVTIKVCGGAISTASGSLSQSNWSRNTNAIPALNTMAVQYYKTNFAQIHYSGATLTSNAYQSSLRSAMSRAGV
jgi:hypothetical protein